MGASGKVGQRHEPIDNAYILPDEDGDCVIEIDEPEPIDCLPPTWSDVLPLMADSPHWYPGDVDQGILEMIDDV